MIRTYTLLFIFFSISINLYSQSNPTASARSLGEVTFKDVEDKLKSTYGNATTDRIRNKYKLEAMMLYFGNKPYSLEVSGKQKTVFTIMDLPVDKKWYKSLHKQALEQLEMFTNKYGKPALYNKSKLLGAKRKNADGAAELLKAEWLVNEQKIKVEFLHFNNENNPRYSLRIQHIETVPKHKFAPANYYPN
jgi:hypothetical protein